MAINDSIVIDLQKDALDRNSPVSTLLRKSLVVAQKLDLNEIKDWISNELNGYNSDPPDYRKVFGVPEAWNPYRGWIPLVLDDSELGEILSSRLVFQSVAEIEELTNRDSNSFDVPYPEEAQRILGNASNFNTHFALAVERSSFIGILNSVRNTILDWALKLEKRGILGEGLFFNEKEKKTAQSIPQVTNIILGESDSPQIALNSSEVVQMSISRNFDLPKVKQILDQLDEKTDNLGLPKELNEELNSEIETIKAQVKSPKPKNKILQEGLSSVRKILEKASAPLATDLIKSINQLF